MTTFHFDSHLLLDFSGTPMDLATMCIFSPHFVQTTSPCLPLWSHHYWILLRSHWTLPFHSISSCIRMHIYFRICSNLLGFFVYTNITSFLARYLPIKRPLALFMYIHMRWMECSIHMTNPIYMHMHCDGTYMFIYIYPFTYMFQIWFPM